MRHVMRLKTTRFAAVALALLVSASPFPALAGKGAFLPTYHPAPCTGDDCRADDPKSGSTCQGFLCGFMSSKAMQPPVTAAQAAEMERARAAAEAQAAARPPEPQTPVEGAKKKRVAKARPAKPAVPVVTTPSASRASPAVPASPAN